MKASAVARAIATSSGHRLVELRSEAPLLLRETADALFIVGGAAGPLGGDQLELRVDVGAGATLRVRSAAASLAQPGPHGDASSARTTLTVGAAAALEWELEPLVSVQGSHHVVDTVVRLAADARLRLVEELVLGRWEEPSGRVTSRLRVDRDGSPLVAHDLDVGGGAVGWGSAAILGDGVRAVRTELHVGPPAGAACVHRQGAVHAASFPLAADVTLVVALAPAVPAARAASDCVSSALARSGE